QPRLMGMPGGRAVLFGWLISISSVMASAATRFAGYSKDTSCTVGVLVVGSLAPFFFLSMYRADREQKRTSEAASQLAPEVWEAGEPSGIATSVELHGSV